MKISEMDEEFTKCSICLENYDKNVRYPRQLHCEYSNHFIKSLVIKN